ncbi:MAG: Crp/Fnr family transcriptional regulator [Bacteroidetes bacterium]|nr:MAG: Crp/Fnr family transcriptional regulator [Bacteroidota bacterium]
MKITNCRQCGLKQFSAFQDCSDDLLNEIFSNKELKQYDKNEIIIQQNDPFRGVFCIQEGTVKVSTIGNKNKEFVLWFAKPGDIIGIDSFINNKSHLFAATAIVSVSACFIPDGDFKELLNRDPSISRKIIKILCDEISSIEGRIASVSQKSIREQFAEMLISIATKNKKSLEANMPISYSIKDLASTIGTTNNYLYKIISDFNDKNVVTILNKKLVIKDFDKLSLIAIGEESVT